MPSPTVPKRQTPRENPFRLEPKPTVPHLHPVTVCPTLPYRTSHRPFRRRRKPQRGRLIRLTVMLLLAFFLFWPKLPSNVQNWLPKSQTTSTAVVPVAYTYISSPFGPRWGRFHAGIDFAARTGALIYAASAGTVIHSGWEAGYGKSVVLDHGDGRQTRYAHCSQLLAKIGQSVEKGAVIAKVGSTGHSTGPHLHFEVIVNGERKNPAWYYPLHQNEAAELASH